MKNLKKALGALLIYHLLFLQGTGKKKNYHISPQITRAFSNTLSAS